MNPAFAIDKITAFLQRCFIAEHEGPHVPLEGICKCHDLCVRVRTQRLPEFEG